MSEYTAIPEPQKSVDGLYNTVTALKNAVETLTGLRTNPKRLRPMSPAAPSVFYQTDTPRNPDAGDIWVSPADPARILKGNDSSWKWEYNPGIVTRIFDGTNWTTLSVAGGFFEYRLMANYNLGSTAITTIGSTPLIGAQDQCWYFDLTLQMYDAVGAAVLNAMLELDDGTGLGNASHVSGNTTWGHVCRATGFVRFDRPHSLNIKAQDVSSTSGTVSTTYIYSTTPANLASGLKMIRLW